MYDKINYDSLMGCDVATNVISKTNFTTIMNNIIDNIKNSDGDLRDRIITSLAENKTIYLEKKYVPTYIYSIDQEIKKLKTEINNLSTELTNMRNRLRDDIGVSLIECEHALKDDGYLLKGVTLDKIKFEEGKDLEGCYKKVGDIIISLDKLIKEVDAYPDTIEMAYDLWNSEVAHAEYMSCYDT